jgi:hypothetical protein
MEILNKIKDCAAKLVSYVKSKATKSSPESLIAEAEARVEKSKKAAERQLLSIQELTASLKKEMKLKEEELLELKECIALAVNDNDKELLVSLLLEEEAAEEAFIAQKKIYDNAVADAVKISDNYRRFTSDINSLLRELSTLKTRAQFLKMREQIVIVENRFEQQTLSDSSRQSKASADSTARRIDLVKQNSSRKKALEKATALLATEKR